MWVGQQLADGLDFWGFLGSLILGGIILGIYTGLLGYVGAKTGLSLDLLSQRAFGEKGSYLPSAMTSFTQIGWFGVGSFVSGGTATPNFARFAKNGKSGAITTGCGFLYRKFPDVFLRCCFLDLCRRKRYLRGYGPPEPVLPGCSRSRS